MQTLQRFFADDTALLTTENNVDNLQHLTNSESSRASNWMMANNLVVNKAKTVALLVFPLTKKSTSSLTLNFDNQIVNLRNQQNIGEFLLMNTYRLSLILYFWKRRLQVLLAFLLN